MTDIQVSKEDLNKSFFQDFKKGNTVGFNQDGTIKHYKIIRLNKSKQTATLRPITLYTEEQMNAMSKEDAEDIMRGKL